MPHGGCSAERIANAAWNACSGENEKLISVLKRITSIGPGAPSEYCGDIDCFYCSAYIGGGVNHEDDCPHAEAIRLLG